MTSRSVSRVRSRGFPALSSGNITAPKNAENKPLDSPEKTPPAKDGLSALAARVLDQLSLTSWLPAALLTAGLAVLFQFRLMNAIDLPRAIAELAGEPLQLLVMMLPLLVIATMITQAFSFSAIRTLEGYWRIGGLVGALASLLTRRHARKKSRRYAEKEKYERRAFATARERMLAQGIPVPIVCVLEARLYGQTPNIVLSEAETLDMEAMRWEDFCPPWQVQRLDHLGSATPIYPPQTSRILPTSLGNRLRATEDTLENTNGDLEGFVLSRWSEMPGHLRVHHDEFRDRLEMYCILVFVAASLSVASVFLLTNSEIHLWQVGLVALGFLVLSCVCYGAAITSASGYCSILKQIDRL